MLTKFVILFCAFVVSLAIPQQGAAPLPSPNPQASESRVYCAEIPENIFQCLGNPKLVNQNVTLKCSKRLSECDRYKCLFRESGWSSSKDDKVNKQKVAESFNQYAIEHPMWSAAVQHLKAACLDKDLPAQGTIQDCAAYDVLHCIQTSFLKNASPSQWLTTPECVYPRSFAASCPVCPETCMAAQVPYGTCNACLALPRSP